MDPRSTYWGGCINSSRKVWMPASCRPPPAGPRPRRTVAWVLRGGSAREDICLKRIGSGLVVGGGLWALGCGPWAVGRGPWAVGSGLENLELRILSWARDSEPVAEDFRLAIFD